MKDDELIGPGLDNYGRNPAPRLTITKKRRCRDVYKSIMKLIKRKESV